VSDEMMFGIAKMPYEMAIYWWDVECNWNPRAEKFRTNAPAYGDCKQKAMWSIRNDEVRVCRDCLDSNLLQQWRQTARRIEHT